LLGIFLKIIKVIITKIISPQYLYGKWIKQYLREYFNEGRFYIYKTYCCAARMSTKKFKQHERNYITRWSGSTFFGDWQRGRRSRATGWGVEGEKTMVTECGGWCTTVGEDHEINMYVGGYGPRGSGVASNPRLLIGQRPP